MKQDIAKIAVFFPLSLSPSLLHYSSKKKNIFGWTSPSLFCSSIVTLWKKHINKNVVGCKIWMKQKILVTLPPEQSNRKNNWKVEFYQRNRSLIDETHSIPMIVFNSSPRNLAIACNYNSIYPCEHWAKNCLIFTIWINSTWCSPSHSRFVAGSCIYNSIDSIEQYWWWCKAR